MNVVTMVYVDEAYRYLYDTCKPVQAMICEVGSCIFAAFSHAHSSQQELSWAGRTYLP